MRARVRIYGVTGWKNAGKTTLVTRLVSEFCARGLRVSTIKHAHHDTDIDEPGRDSYRHREAGAAQVLLASPRRWALMSELRDAPEPPLEALLSRLDPVDLVLIEGYKTGAHPKIEAWRADLGKPPLALSDGARSRAIRALACDAPPAGLGCPVLDLDDPAGVADFILQDFDHD